MGWKELLGWPSGPPGGAVPEVRAVNHAGGATIVPSASWEEWASFIGMSTGDVQLPPVSIDSALEVPAVFGVVNFLPGLMATLPLHAFKGEAEKIDGELAMLLNEAPNPEWTSFDWRKHMWQQVLTGGRGFTWIERSGGKVVALWPMDPVRTLVKRRDGRKFYELDGKVYSADEVIDIAYMLKADGLGHYSPVQKARKAIALALAMNDFAANFFAGGGVPPLALEGPLPQGPANFQRAMADIQRAVDQAKSAGRPFFGMPPGHSLKQIGFDPAKGQMVEARLFQIQEIARVWGLPPAFVQDLSHGTMANTEQQDLNLVKHKVLHLARQFEDELNLKLFGQRRRARKVKHNLDGIQRADFRTRIEGMARGIQTGQLTPNEARALEERPPLEHGDSLLVQGATVPLGSQADPGAAPQTVTTEEDNADDGQQAQP